MARVIRLKATSSRVLVESLLASIESKNEEIKELKAQAAAKAEREDKRYSEDFVAHDILTDFIGKQHPELVPELLEYAMAAAKTDEHPYMAEGALKAVAWHLEATGNEKGHLDFVAIIKSKKDNLMNELNVSLTESVIINESLLGTVERLQAEVQKLKSESANESVAGSLLRRFLVERKPESTSELVDFIITAVKDGGYDNPISGGGVSALEYHRDVIINSDLDRGLLKLAQLKKEGF